MAAERSANCLHWEAVQLSRLHDQLLNLSGCNKHLHEIVPFHQVYSVRLRARVLGLTVSKPGGSRYTGSAALPL